MNIPKTTIINRKTGEIVEPDPPNKGDYML
jgi:hypothetical protein